MCQSNEPIVEEEPKQEINVRIEDIEPAIFNQINQQILKLREKREKTKIVTETAVVATTSNAIVAVIPTDSDAVV